VCRGKIIFEVPRWIDYATAFRYNLHIGKEQTIDSAYE
jgi:hypothetical protein